MNEDSRNRRPLVPRGAQRGFSIVEIMMAAIIAGILAAIAIPSVLTVLSNMRTLGDARGLNDEIALAKMRAAANFTLARVYADLSAGTFHLEYWEKPDTTCPTGCWVTEGGTQTLSSGVSYGTGGISSPPNLTQTTIGQAPACLQNPSDATSTVSNTACVVFNSRGIPMDYTQAPTSEDALYITDGKALVFGLTVSATGVIRTWQGATNSTNWTRR
jgi:prepilin-type N-terminal cleavage/methylation domain-containing protein